MTAKMRDMIDWIECMDIQEADVFNMFEVNSYGYGEIIRSHRMDCAWRLHNGPCAIQKPDKDTRRGRVHVDIFHMRSWTHDPLVGAMDMYTVQPRPEYPRG